ncbi:hypothetical protein ACLOJK_004626 [Asimina triloba]
MAKTPLTLSDRHYTDRLTVQGCNRSPSSDENLTCASCTPFTTCASNRGPVTSNCICRNPWSLAYTPCTLSASSTPDRRHMPNDRHLNNIDDRNLLSTGLIKAATGAPIRGCLTIIL